MKNIVEGLPLNNSLSPVQIESALRHLGLMGYSDGDRVYIRTIAATGQAQNLEATYPNLRELPTDKNVYFVVNGGGNKDKDVAQCRAIFYEHDNLEKNVQIDLWATLALPEPTFQIDTGGKSIHSYWVLADPISVGQWRSLQSDLLEFADADRTNKNPSRVMRLAGGIHQKTGQQATIITESGNRYTCQQLRGAIPEQAKPERKERPKAAPTVGAIPMTVILDPKNRELIDSGSSKGGRNALGAYLARDLIGCEGWLRASGIEFDGTAEGLFQDYCDRCNPHLDEWERGTIWRSAVGDDPTPSLSDEKLKGCIQAWRYKQGDGQPQPRAAKTSTERAFEGNGRILAAVDPGRETDRENNGAQAASELSKAIQGGLDQGFEDFPIETVLPTTIAKPLVELSARLNVPRGVMLAMLLPICASLLKIEAGIKLPGGTHQVEPPILWTCFYGESGNAKSPIQRLLMMGLNQLRKDANILYENAFEQYEDLLAQWEAKPKKDRNGAPPKSPNRRIYYLSSTTTEAVILKQSLQPKQGFLVAVDELAGLFKSFNQYKSKGDDLEAWLQFYDGLGIEQARVSRDDVYLDAVGFSVVGGIQPCKLKVAMGDMSAQDGMWARYTYIRIPTTRTPELSEEEDIDLNPLEDLYRRLDKLAPSVVSLSVDANPVWRDWVKWCDDARLSEGHEALRVLYPKLKARAGRIALVLAAIHGEGQISSERIESAIAFTKWSLRQTLSIYDELGLADNPEAEKVTRFVSKFRDAGWLKPRTVQRSIGRIKADQARTFMAKIVELGFAESNGKQSTDSDYEIKILKKPVDTLTKLAERPKVKPLACQQTRLTVVDNVDNPTSNHDLATDLSTLSTTVKNYVDSQNGSLVRNPDHLSTCQQVSNGFKIDDDEIDWEVSA
jgi:Protein of unknown function (DUF3987)